MYRNAIASLSSHPLGRYLLKMNVPGDLGRRIRRHFRHFFENKSSLDESTILMEMSTALRQELTDFLVQGGPMSEVALFHSMSPVYWARVLPLLRPCMFARDEVICRQGEDCVESYVFCCSFCCFYVFFFFCFYLLLLLLLLLGRVVSF